jgi:tRNA dimethylallyltransferase
VLRQYRIPDVPEAPELRARLMRRPHAELVAKLEAADPALAAQTDLASTKRVVRALEIVAHARGGPVETSAPLGVELRFRVFGVRIPRPELHRRIDLRLEERLRAGMVVEVQGLLDRGVRLERLRQLGMEYRHLAEHVVGETSLERATAALRREIRHLAKRQETYFRGLPRRGIPVTAIAPGDAGPILAAVAAGRWECLRSGGGNRSARPAVC